MRYLVLLLVVLPSFFISAYGQEDPVLSESDNKFVNELRRNEPRPKFFEFNYAGVENYNVTTSSEEFENAESEVDLNKRISFKLRAPLLLKERLTVLTGFQLRKEFFEFINTNPDDSRFFNDFSRRFLSSAGMSIIVKKDITEDKAYYIYWNGSLNSDEVSFNQFSDQLKTNVVFISVENINAVTQIGYGGGFGYIFGGASVFPVLIYNRTFSRSWSLETMLPKSVSMRFHPNPETNVSLKADVTGASYFIKDQPIDGYEKLTFQRSDLNLGVHLEREIYDFLWFGLSAGYNVPLNLYLSEPRKSRKEGLVVLNAEPAPILSFSVFLVVPKKIYYKKGKKR